MKEKSFVKIHGAVLLAFGLLFVASAVGSRAYSASFRIGVLTPGGSFEPALMGLREGLNRYGYKEAKDFTVIVKDTKGAVSDLGRHAKAALEAKPAVLFTVTTALSIAARQATSDIPIVFNWVSDPVRSGLIASYASSKNNVTGVTSYAGPLSGKRLEVLKEVAPGIKRLLALVSPRETIALESAQFLEDAAKRLGVRVDRRDVISKEEIEKVIEATPKGSVDAIYHVPSTLVGAHIDLLIKKARKDKIPLVVHEAAMVERGALLTFGADFRLSAIQAARLVAKILKGEKPSDIPTETPAKLLLVINSTTAKAIGLKIPGSIVDRVDRVVE